MGNRDLCCALSSPCPCWVRQEEGREEALGSAPLEGKIPSCEVQNTRLSQHPSQVDIPALWSHKDKQAITSSSSNPVQIRVVSGETEAREG